MKNIQQKLLALLFLLLTFSPFGFAQTAFTPAFSYDIHRVYPPFSTTKEKLETAQTLLDLRPTYEASWVETYISVEISASHRGQIKRAVSKNDTLSQAQKALLYGADVGAPITVHVLYTPKNNLKQKESKEITFTFTVDPEQEATYIDDTQPLKQYLAEQLMDNIPIDSFEPYQLAAVKFAIDEQGQVVDVRVFESTRNKAIDDLLVATVCNMPTWQPATYANGLKVRQEFVLTVGDMESCVVHTLDISRR